MWKIKYSSKFEVIEWQWMDLINKNADKSFGRDFMQLHYGFLHLVEVDFFLRNIGVGAYLFIFFFTSFNVLLGIRPICVASVATIIFLLALFAIIEHY
jgi:hypothetical protein